MSSLQDQLTQASAHNGHLLTILTETDYAVPSLQQTNAFVTDLQNQIFQTTENLKRLHSATEQERLDHKKMQQSVMKRYAYKMGGTRGKEKFASKQEKEEREFLEAWQREREAVGAKEELEAALKNAQQEKASLETQTQRHHDAQAELDRMYQAIFAGPTPEVPGEDQLEEALRQARADFEQTQAAASGDHIALAALSRADKHMQKALREMNRAYDAAGLDVVGGGAGVDMYKRDALSLAQESLTQALRCFGEAQRARPEIRDLSAVHIEQGHFLSDVLFDNVFSDMDFRESVKEGDEQLKRADQELSGWLKTVQEQQPLSQKASDEAGVRLNRARLHLQTVRSEAFERLAGGGGTAPPSYQ